MESDFCELHNIQSILPLLIFPHISIFRPYQSLNCQIYITAARTKIGRIEKRLQDNPVLWLINKFYQIWNA